MTVEILKPPAYAPWQGMTEWARDVVRTAVSTETNFSTTLVTATLFRVPANTVVLSAGMIISSTIDAGSSDVLLTLGDSDDAAGWMQAANLACTVISSELKTSRNVLLTTALTADLNAYGAGKIYSADQDINVVSGASNLVGQMDVYLVYSRVG
jgi:hypothetical protein